MASLLFFIFVAGCVGGVLLHLVDLGVSSMKDKRSKAAISLELEKEDD